MGKSVLIIDDDELTRELLRQILTTLEFNKVRSCNSYISAKNIIGKLTEDIVFLDIELGDGNGLNLIKDIKKARPEVVIIVFSSHTSPKNVQMAIKAGAHSFLGKPFSVQSLKQNLKKTGLYLDTE